MFSCTSRVLITAAVLNWVSAARGAEPAVADSIPSAEFFESKVKPLLAMHCLKCHGGDGKVKGGLYLTSREGILKGGDSGPAISLATPRESLLLEAVNYTGVEMPPSGKLPEEQIAVLTKWVDLGLPWGTQRELAERTAGGHGPPPVDENSRAFWSFQPVAAPNPPTTGESGWVRTPIDAFVLARLQQDGLAPSPPAEKSVLLRRAYYDLIGLPPSPEEAEAFLADNSPEAFERVVDALLESPHYGERWGRHWLDLVRYAETNSYERDGPKPFVWRYRDYVIRSFNDDKPYDQFATEQLAGDELDLVTRDTIIATGYYRLGIWQDEPVDPEQELFEDLDDLVRTTGEVFLGLTIGCARCHDHKLEPLPQTDYYRMLAFFRNVRRFGVRSQESIDDASVCSLASREEIRRNQQQIASHKHQTKEVRDALRALNERIVAALVGVEKDDWKTEAMRVEIARRQIGKALSQQEFARYAELMVRYDELAKSRPDGLEKALCVKEHGRECPPTHVLVRGNAHAAAAQVEPGFPSVLSRPAPVFSLPAEGVQSTGRRRALAQWITRPENPLTARVMVNRIWHYHFGRGIVRSTSDFGFQGIRPTHPELLDWLAADFVAGGWRLKRLHKLIMLSNTYQMSSQASEKALAADPLNNRLWRFDMRRLSAEEIRDSILAASDSLNRGAMFGPSVYVTVPDEVLAGQSMPGAGWGDASPADNSRRTIYIHAKRSLAVPMIASFDGPESDASCPARFVTTQPTQALGMLNSSFVNEQATCFASYLRERAGDSQKAQITLALRRLFQREPTRGEIDRGLKLVALLQKKHGLSAELALKQFCVAAYSLNEFVYLD
ncbi:MAG TPA: PSD1 and planctomycete cytochrome C domain-containing protein [Pirellulales bacterium]|nr:PSD1 and planctomycete cytochrome C domain-containing protein [Pirellulales bacterium]